MSLKPIHWYNILADLPEPMAPSLNPQTHEPVGPEDLAGIFPMELIKQEVSHQRDIEIPEEVQQYYRQWRTPWTSCPLCKLLLQPGYIGCHARSETA